MKTKQTWQDQLAATLDALQQIAGSHKPDIRRICASIARKERVGKLPANVGYSFAASAARSALRMAALGALPCGSDFISRCAACETEKAAAWLAKAQQSTIPK